MRKPRSARPGGRTARTHAAVLEATLAELAERGYDQMSVESVALRAGVHKTTIYRRWRTKDRLVAEALATAAEQRIKPPDTGDIGEDLRILANATLTTLASPEGGAIVRALVSSAGASPEVQQIARQFWIARLAQVEPIIERAVARGELPPSTCAARVLEYMAAPLYYRLLITGEPLTEAVAHLAAAAALVVAQSGVLTSV